MHDITWCRMHCKPLKKHWMGLLPVENSDPLVDGKYRSRFSLTCKCEGPGTLRGLKASAIQLGPVSLHRSLTTTRSGSCVTYYTMKILSLIGVRDQRSMFWQWLATLGALEWFLQFFGFWNLVPLYSGTLTTGCVCVVQWKKLWLSSKKTFSRGLTSV